MSKSLRSKLAFFKECLEAESRSQTIWNFPTSKSEHVFTVASIGSRLTVPQKYLSSVSEVIEFYTREKQLMLSSAYIEGRYKVPSFAGSTRLKTIRCPIFLFTCELSDEGVVVDVKEGNINPAAIQILEQHGIDAEPRLHELLEWLLDEPTQSTRASLKNSKNSNLSADNQASVFEVLGQELSNLSDGVLLLADECNLSIERKLASAQGSLYELEAMEGLRKFSQPLEMILGEKRVAKPADNSVSLWRKFFTWLSISKSPPPLPETLSAAQASVLESAANYPLSVVSGPPGTGKSFTIACLALREFSQGKSVLVVSQNQHAADVVRRKLIDDMGIEAGLTALASERGVSADVKQQIKSMLRSRYSVDKRSLKRSRRALDELFKKLAELETDYQAHVERLNNSGIARPAVDNGFWRFGRARVADDDLPLYQKFLDIEELDQKIKANVICFIRTQYEFSANELARKPSARESLRAFADSLTARNEHYQHNYYQKVDFSEVLKAIPFWFAAVGNLQRVLPLKRELFDLVVIDEATQCNLSICLPALQRAKRAVIVGDNKQLKHVSFLSYEIQQRLAEKYALNSSTLSTDFRNNSVLDYAASACQWPQQSALLDEHFRSHPQIIEFSNREFYDGALKVMTERPTNLQCSIGVIEVDGRRLAKGLNKQEGQAVVDELKRIIHQQRSLPETEVHTLGVLAFFSTQASHLEKLIFDEISLNDLRRHNIRVGNPFSFQGEERDHMLISCSVDAKTAGGSYTYLNRDDVFNVAITRARSYLTLFVSCKVDEIRSGSKLASYLKYIQSYLPQHNNSMTVGYDALQAEIADWLSKRGVEVFKNYTVAGTSIDIMAVYQGRAVAIDLVGFDGQLQGALSLTQLKLLQRAGLESFLLPYQEWKAQAEVVLHTLMLRLGAAQKLPEDHAWLDKFDEQQESVFSKITAGVSINQLNTRFLNTGEIMASEHLQGLVTRYFRFIECLNTNFIPGELTFKRYHNALNELTSHCLDNLQKASVCAELANSMLRQQKELYGDVHSQNQFSNEFDDVIAARLSMIDEQRAKLKSLLVESEKSQLQMDKTMIKLNEINSDKLVIDPIETLKELTERLDMYRGLTR